MTETYDSPWYVDHAGERHPFPDHESALRWRYDSMREWVSRVDGDPDWLIAPDDDRSTVVMADDRLTFQATWWLTTPEKLRERDEQKAEFDAWVLQTYRDDVTNLADSLRMIAEAADDHSFVLADGYLDRQLSADLVVMASRRFADAVLKHPESLSTYLPRVFRQFVDAFTGSRPGILADLDVRLADDVWHAFVALTADRVMVTDRVIARETKADEDWENELREMDAEMVL